jgi:hypothetical protein
MMKQTLILEANGGADSGVLLLSLAMVFCEHQLAPESLVWIAIPETGEIRVWAELVGAPEKLDAVTEQCRDIAGVRYLSLHAPDKSPAMLDRLRTLVAGPNNGAEKAPFTD